MKREANISKVQTGADELACGEGSAQSTEETGTALDFLWAFQEQGAAADGALGENQEANNVAGAGDGGDGTLNSALADYSRWLESSLDAD